MMGSSVSERGEGKVERLPRCNKVGGLLLPVARISSEK